MLLHKVKLMFSMPLLIRSKTEMGTTSDPKSFVFGHYPSGFSRPMIRTVSNKIAIHCCAKRQCFKMIHFHGP